MADVGGVVAVRVPAADAVLRVGRVLEVGAGPRGVVDAEPQATRRGPPRGRRRADRRRSRRASSPPRARPRRRATARRCARARRSGRAGRGRGCPSATTRGRVRRITSGSTNSSTSSSPSSASRAVRSVDAIPDARLAPELFQASRRGGERIALAIAVVVVLPFVAETSATPCGSAAARPSSAPGSSFQTSLPGSVVPPPRPAARESRADEAGRGGLDGESGAHRERAYPRSAMLAVCLK